MELHSFLWHLVFEYLGPEDLAREASVCLIWWEIVFCGWKSIAQTFLECGDLNLVNAGRLYQILSLKLLSSLHRINLSGTSISSQHFLQLVSTARRLRELNIECCTEIGEQAIFKAKSSLRLLWKINISQNGQFGILVMACLCSLDALEETTARGISLFLSTEKYYFVEYLPTARKWTQSRNWHDGWQILFWHSGHGFGPWWFTWLILKCRKFATRSFILYVAFVTFSHDFGTLPVSRWFVAVLDHKLTVSLGKMYFWTNLCGILHHSNFLAFGAWKLSRL